MRHPSEAALLELHFGERAGPDGDALGAHVRECAACGAYLDELRGLEQALAAGEDDAPPADGLQRVLARVAAVPPARARRDEWARAALPGAAALVAAAWAVRAGADRLAVSGAVPAGVAGTLAGDVLVTSLAAAGVFCFGALVTLALAPVLILDSHGRS